MKDRTIRKPGKGTAMTAYGPFDYSWDTTGKVVIEDHEEAELYLHKTLNNPRGKWALIVACCQGPSDASPRRAIERGLKEIVGYCLC